MKEEYFGFADDAVRKLRARGPLVLCLTNTVAANFTANVLLALGAKPAMMEDPEEAAELAAVSSALLVNVGTVTRAQAGVMRAAIASARRAGIPWVLDPVAHHLLSYRRALVAEFLAQGPALVRGNAAEIGALGAAAAPLVTLATGPVDVLRAPDRAPLEIEGGNPMLQRVTATGCAQGAVCAAFAAVLPPYGAALAASVVLKRAGEALSDKAPGSLQAGLLDELAR